MWANGVISLHSSAVLKSQNEPKLIIFVRTNDAQTIDNECQFDGDNTLG
jgi:hypothetical protein